MDVICGIANESFLLLVRMAPYLLLGIAAAGAMHILLPQGLVARLLGGPGLKPTFRSAILGVPLPLCSCSVVPVASSLRKSGAGKGATVSFLITTPTSGVDSILATYAMLGAAFTVARVVASFLIGLLAGVITRFVTRHEPEESAKGDNRTEETAPGDRQTAFARGLRYAFGDLLGGMAKSLALGILLGGALAYLIPSGLLEQTIGSGIVSYLVMMAFGIPLYVCASGSIPLAAALLAKGISPGAALVFLITGPATNAATITVVSQMLGKKALFVFLALIGAGALLSGALLDTLFTGGALLGPYLTPHHAHDGLGVLETTCALLLAALVVYHIVRPHLSRMGRPRGNRDMLRIKVKDMSCQHCAGAITKAASGVPGVKRISANPVDKLVEVDTDEGADPNAILKAIEEAGFSPEMIASREE
jgi:uncharacterized membrane protein YraQ (UPF0718 family)/copper chaperone CopZ